jgi:phytoene synthase
MSRDTSFYYSFLVLPPRKRRAIVAVWDFCRAVDDAVDETGPADAGVEAAKARAIHALAHWRRELDACFAANSAAAEAPATEQGRALAPFIHEFNLPRTPFNELIDGVAMDLSCSRYATFHALEEYCRRVACTVGLICVEIFGYRDPRSRDYAVALGMALQLTNIVRDVSSDLERGRVYLPEEDLARFGVGEADLRAGRMTPAVRDLLRFQCDRARTFYRRAADTLPAVDARSLLAAEIMGAIYLAILERIERAGYDVFRERLRVPRPARALIALRYWLRSFGPRA